ncbi:lipid A core - O-antigen ligase [Paenibacillus popilliae ATCC 14706]|uniref:Lipid A core-O-antigen ligase n=2 Tax=Paenibacillus popilliae TaxID=78057 RepID=M9LGD4_PAEPP|nr:lipid A core - O-antigen ligase [Paenibacillus popilliae ATCC 14706]
MKLVADYPVFGAGGGAWSALYEKYQNNPYESAQAHSYYMQYLVETGVLGFIILLGFLGVVYGKYVQSFRKAEEIQRNRYFMYFILATSILVHSVMDFNMSYVYIGILVFISLGGMAASISKQPLKRIKPQTLKAAAASIVGIAGVIMFITSVLFIQASSSFAKANKTLVETKDFNQTMQYLNKALKIRSTVPEYAALKADLFKQVYAQQGDEAFFAEAEHTLRQALDKQPGNRILLLRLVALYEQKGMDSERYKVYSENAERFPWDMEWYDKYMDATLRQGIVVTNESPDQKNEYMDEIIAALRHVEQGVEHLKTLPEGQLQGREFSVTSSMAINAGRAYMMKGEPGQGAEAMKPYLNEDLSNVDNRELARWYIGATIQNGQVDQGWYDQLISVDPEEKEQIEQVAGMRF